MSRLLQLEQVCHKITDGSHNPPKGVELSEYVMLSSKNILDGEITFEKPRYLKPEDFFSENKRTNIEIGDVLLTIVGTIGRCAIVDEIKQAFTLQRSVAVLKPNKEIILPKYLMFALQNMTSKFEGAARGVAQKGIYLKSLKQFEVFVPPLAEQQRIVAKLDAAFAEIDAAIDANSRNIINTNKLFEEHRNNIYEALLQNSKVTKVKEIANLSRGHNPPKSSFINEPRDGYVRFYQIRDAKSDKFATYVPNSDKLHLVNEKEFLMNAYRHIGEVFRGVNGAFNVALCKLTIKDFNKVCEDYLYYMIPSNLIKGELLKLSERSLIPSMSVKELAELNVPLPSFDKQEEVARNIENLKSKTQTLNSIYQQKHAYFENLKSAVLAKELQSEAA